MCAAYIMGHDSIWNGDRDSSVWQGFDGVDEDLNDSYLTNHWSADIDDFINAFSNSVINSTGAPSRTNHLSSQQHPEHDRLLVQHEPLLVQTLESVENDNTGSLVVTPELSKPSMARRQRRKMAVTQQEWEDRKYEIERLCKEEGRTLTEVMNTMESRGFTATRKGYKTQLSRWGIHKYVPADLLSYMKFKLNERRDLQNKDTDFFYQGKRYTSSTLQRRLARREKSGTIDVPKDCRTPDGLKYGTPVLTPEPSTPRGIDLLSPPAPDPVEDTSTIFMANVCSPTILDPQSLIEQARRLEKMGKFDEARVLFEQAIERLSALHSRTHESTVAVVYELAQCAAKGGYHEEADQVLDSITSTILGENDIKGGTSVKHMFRIMEIFDAWTPLTDSTSFQQLQNTTLVPGHSEIFGSIGERPSTSDDPADDRLKHARSLLSRLLEVCEANPGQLAEQALKCRAENLHLLHTECQIDGHSSPKVQRHLASARDAFWKLYRSNIPMTPSLIGSFVHMAAIFVRFHHFKEADEMFSRLERKAHCLSLRNEDSQILIDFLLQVGLVLQSERTWKHARPWFEHALTVCYKSVADVKVLARQLEEALRRRKFEHSEVIVRLKRSSAFCNSVLPWH